MKPSVCQLRPTTSEVLPFNASSTAESYPPSNTVVNTPNGPYRPIRFDMDAAAIMNTNQAAVDIDESSKPATTFLSLARELRDPIYEDLVGTKYRFDTYQILNGVPHFSEPPTLSEPKSDSEKLSPNESYGEVRQLYAEVLYKYPFPPPASFSILRTSSKVRDEALQVIYQKGTLLFVIDHPSQDPVSTKQSNILMKHFNNVEIFLDLVSISNHSLSIQDTNRAMQVTMHLIQRLADYTSGGGTCTLSIYHFHPSSWLQFCFFEYLTLHAGELCIFKKVVLRFGDSSRITEEGFTGSSAELAAKRCDCQKLARSMYDRIALDEDIRCLGPCEKSYDSEGLFCMVFYPKNQFGGGGCPNGRREVNGGRWQESWEES